LIPARVLEEIERRTGRPVSALFDLIAGTSTGGILALGLTRADGQGAPMYSSAQLAELYRREGRRIFSRSWWHAVTSGDGWFDERYPSSGVEGVLREYFGAARLKDALTDVFITSYEIEIRQPYFFRSYRAPLLPEYDFAQWEVARATSAAPTYFEAARLASQEPNRAYWALVDGGVYANNPALCAYVEARNEFPRQFPRQRDDVLVVSLGTGSRNRPLPWPEAKDWGKIEWAEPILDVVFDGVSDTINYQMMQLLDTAEARRRFYRFDAQLTSQTDDLDDASPENLERLESLARDVIQRQATDLAQLVSQL
jgi:patatin-like phospholipase/acyl hydrolase